MELKGTLERYLDRDRDTQKSLFSLRNDEFDITIPTDKYGLVKCYGMIPTWPKETHLILNGSFSNGVFILTNAKPYTETEAMSLKLLKKIKKEFEEEDSEIVLTEAAIKKILKVTGPDILSFSDRLDMDDILIEKLPKLKPEIIKATCTKIRLISLSYGVVEYLSQFGCSIKGCMKLVELYGKTATAQIKSYPYLVGFKAGLDFSVRDQIAKKEGIDAYDKERIKTIIYTALYQNLEQNGSTYTTSKDLVKTVNKIVRTSSFPREKIDASIVALQLQEMNGIVIEQKNKEIRIYKKSFYNSERNIAFNLRRIENSKTVYSEYSPDIPYEIQEETGIKYGKMQIKAFNLLKSSGIKIITGGPGTGKTTLINGILYGYEKIHPGNTLTLCAPTGRASQRMKEVTRREALTIHKVLDFKPFGDDTMMHKDESDPIDTDLIVIDEMSMVDTTLFNILISAIKDNTTVILVGDENQLQSVDSGNVLHDLIETKLFETYRLKEVFRQKGSNRIVDNAYNILKGSLSFDKGPEFEIEHYENEEDAKKILMEDYFKLYDSKIRDKVQILTPTRIGDVGTIQINRDISEKLYDEDQPNFISKGQKYHVGDKVIFEKNNYDKGYYNGDIGEVSAIFEKGYSVNLSGEDINITGECLQDVTLAYAISIHKSQGSEAETVLIMLADTYTNMLTRNLLFTAITRAKKKIKIYCVNSALSDCVMRKTDNLRKTGLAERITEIVKKI